MPQQVFRNGRYRKGEDMEKMSAQQLIAFLGKIEKLKSVPRHCVTADGVAENVAAHSWRTAVMAYLLKDELEDMDTDKIIRMCLLHDIGEAVTGDIPAFEKTQGHEAVEKLAVHDLLKSLPEPLYQETSALFEEMEALVTREARVYKALDKLEAVIQHNQSDIRTWLPLEYELQKTYAAEAVKGFSVLEQLQEECVRETEKKIEEYSRE